MKKNKDLFLNGTVDNILSGEIEQMDQRLRKSKSAVILKSEFHNRLLDNDSLSCSSCIESFAKSWPAMNIDEDDTRNDFGQFLEEIKQREFDKNNKGEQYSDQVSNNILYSARSPEPEVIVVETEC